MSAVSARQRKGFLNEQECPESGDRDRFRRISFLFQFVDGGVRAIRCGDEKGLRLGHQRYAHADEFLHSDDSRHN